MTRRLEIIVMCAALVVAAAGLASSTEQSFAVEPDDRSAVVDSTVSLPCKVNDLAGKLQWTKDDFALGTNRNLSYHGYPRYAMTGSDANGEYNLKLNPVTLDDDGVYQCQVGTGKRGDPAIRSRKATLTVLVPPNRPRITPQGDTIYLTENSPIDLECISEGGKPHAEITWTDGYGKVIEDGTETSIEAMAAESKRFTTKSVLRFIPKMEHHNTSISCHAHNSAIDKKLQTKIHLNVKFAPKITLTIAGPARKLVEGTDVQFLCLTKANPPEVNYRWFVNDQYAPSEVTSELWLFNISRRLHNSLVRCEAQNSVEKTEESKALSILYKPQFKNRPKNVQGDNGSYVTIMCDVDSNPPPTIEWTFERTKRVVSVTGNLTVQVTNITVGRYHCKATTSRFGEVNAEATVSMRGKPVINSPQVQYGSLSETVRLECVATSVPVADEIIWTYHRVRIGNNKDQNYYSALEDPIDDGVKSTLIIRKSVQEHFGTYNCTAHNEYGSDTMMIVLVPKKDFMLILSIIGAVGGIIVMILIFSVIGFCRRTTSQKNKKAKSDFNGESDVENKQNAAARESDASSNVSDIKMETGTGSSLSNYRYKIDYGADSLTVTTTATAVDDQHPRSATPKSGGGSQTTLPRSGGGIPLAGPVPVDPRYATAAGYLGHMHPHNVMHHPLANGAAIGDYADPLNYVRYTNNHLADRPTSSNNGYIAADKLYDLNPMPPPQTVIALSSSSSSSPSPKLSLDATARTSTGGDPATLLQYSATYGNPYLRPASAQWPAQPPRPLQKYDAYGRPEPPPYSSVGKGKRKTAAAGHGPSAATVPVGPNYHIGVAKRQTLATHV
ncbi:irregular chiasm C-roughest protein [Acyrthosiphon pisum]|uniref:Ig-like domain-containing protein n=1 Tax=Acyrthosiphon pisum TaxID=7029 RepID=A0A8R2NV84_ACYPI|nr:irregular chiasm C-roughest protein [Acyrthosiphon pisum]|eukprot:XP_008188823.2 PREDICTED: irregular chiasm C-roughest protein [Acyrthosiphon pisum]